VRVLLLLSLLAAPAAQAAPKAKAAAAAAVGDPTKLPAWKAQQLVDSTKLPSFFYPADLSLAPVVSAKGAALIDFDTGEILWEKNGTLRRYPASTTKILTCLLLAEKTQPTDVITCMDPKIRQIEESSLHIQPWEKFTSKDLLYGTMLRSANDGSVVIAEHIAGSVAAFSEMMNERARQAGATDSHFHNPNGLPDDQHWTTARDLALIAREAMKNDRFRDAVSQQRRTIARSKVTQDVVVASKAKKFYQTFPGADGIKTGYTRAAKHCFVGSASRGGRRLIAVVLGSADNASGEAATVLSWAFRRFPSVEVAKAGTNVAAVPVRGGTAPQVPAVAAETLRAVTDVVKAGAPGTGAAAPAVETEVRGADHLYAPVRKGQPVGTLVAKVGGREVGSVALLAAEDVPAAPNPVAAAFGGGVRPWPFVTAGAGLLALVGWGYYGTASAKGPGRRRVRIAPQGRGVDRGRPRAGGR
jgi:D-alanyl-D-alanine carboxypeptidase (penicillin-binding protein 5/6)